MGMTCGLWRVQTSEIERLMADSDALEAFLYTERAAQSPPAGGGLLGFLKRLSPITITTDGPLPPGFPEHRADQLDLDKAWHGLHFLFTGTAWKGEEPASFLVEGGEEMGDDEIGDSIPRLIRPDRVRAFSVFLAGLSAEELKRRFEPARMTKLEIYPEKIWIRDEPSPLEYLLSAFDDLNAFVQGTAAANAGLIVHLS